MIWTAAIAIQHMVISGLVVPKEINYFYSKNIAVIFCSTCSFMLVKLPWRTGVEPVEHHEENRSA